jgi:RimJ/RimL family protein N-acetyltransferase
MVAAAVASTVVMPRTEYYLAVTAGGELVGFVRLALGGVKAAKLGYAIHADHWGNGYATDAARTIVRLGFDELGLHRITAAVGPTNHASMTVLTHLGFAREGTLREHVFTGGRWRDSVLFSLLEHERTPH